jgi:hypothetical protein
LPKSVIEHVNATHEPRQLETWLDHVLTADSLEEMGILATK